jgi:hypothetical protein
VCVCIGRGEDREGSQGRRGYSDVEGIASRGLLFPAFPSDLSILLSPPSLLQLSLHFQPPTPSLKSTAKEQECARHVCPCVCARLSVIASCAAQLLLRMESVFFQAGTVVAHHAEPADRLMIIVSGSIDVLLPGPPPPPH